MIELDPTQRPTLSVDEAAVAFGVSRALVRAAIRDGSVPCLHFGRRMRIPTAAARAMLALDDRGDGGLAERHAAEATQ